MGMVQDLRNYLGDTSWDDETIEQAAVAEMLAQARTCRVDDPNSWLGRPEDLRLALLRRVARALALRALPLGFQTSMTDAAVATTRVGGLDAEIRRLEAPFRKVIVG